MKLYRILGYQEIYDNVLHEQHMSVGPDLYYTIYGYKKNNKTAYLYNIISIIFLGIPYLICYWFPNCKVIKYQKSSLRNASTVLGKLSQRYVY